MFPVSSGFFKAIRNKAPQDIQLEFRNDDYTAGEVITREDIAITAGGLTLTQILNSATDIEFGRAVMSELKVMLLNADGRFTDFNFNREFTAKFGVKVAANKYYVVRTNPGLLGLEDAQGNLRVYYAVDGKVLARIYAEEYKEYYLRGGEPFGAATIILWGTKLYIANLQGQLEGAFEIAADGETPEILPTPTEFPLGITEDDVLAWIEEGVCVEVDEDEEALDGWEYIPLGVFRGKRPESVRGKLIEFTAHDNMQMFDIPAADFIAGLEFPCTLKQIFEKLCDFCGASYVSANDFVNSEKTFAKNPFKDTDHTCREILAYIAEAAGAYAKMAPGGHVGFVYFTQHSGAPTFRRTDRFEMTESEFETPPIDRLEVYNSYSDQLCTSGTGDIVYGISDNPLLYAENSDQVAEMQPYVEAIYNRISLIHAYRPSSFRAEAHPAVECGDVIQVVNDYGETREFPVFAQTITWAGFAKATYENTGGVIRQNAPFTQRELEQLKKKSVKTKDLWGYVDSYLSSEEGISRIKIAVGGEFVTPDELDKYTTTKNLEATVAGYIAPGQASLINALNGKYVSESALKDYVKTTNLASSVTQEIKDGKVKLELSTSEDTSTTSEVDVGTKYSGEYINDSDTTLYEFSDKDSAGYYVSQNGGVAYSCSYIRLDFNFSQETDVTFRCVCQGETRFDYGIISNVDCDLGVNYTPDDDGDIINLDIFYSFRDQHSPDPVDVVMTIPAGSHYVTIKYCKDGSTDAAGDYFKFRAFTLKTESTSSKSTITLWAGEGASRTEISSADITFKGYVTFESLSTPGATTIDGGNINTDNLYVKQVYLDDGKNSQPILHSELEENGSGEVFLGFREYMVNPANPHILKIYAKDIYLMQPGDNEDSKNTLRFSMTTRRIRGNATWLFDELSV